MGDDFPLVAILLFSEEDADIGDVSDHTFVIQDGGMVPLVGAIVKGETDVAEFKGLGAQGGCFTRGVRAKKLTRAHQEEEAYDGEMVDVCVDGALRCWDKQAWLPSWNARLSLTGGQTLPEGPLVSK